MYGKKSNGEYVIFSVKTNDVFPCIVYQYGGLIYIEYEDDNVPPRLLVEDLKNTVNKRQLMKESILFFFAGLFSCNIGLAFGREDCFYAIDRTYGSDCITVIIFGFESFGPDGHINLLLHGKFRMNGCSWKDMDSKVSNMAKQHRWTSDDFPLKAAEYIRQLSRESDEITDTSYVL